MGKKRKSEKSYFELTEHTTTQLIIFNLIAIVSIVTIFILLLPVVQEFFETYLSGNVHNTTGEYYSYTINTDEPTKGINYITSWAIDIKHISAEDSRFWFNPAMSMLLESLIAGFAFAFLVTSLMPQSVGLMRQKIEREIINAVDKIAYNRSGFQSEEESLEIISLLKKAKLPDLMEYASEWQTNLDELILLQKGLKWKESGFLYRLLNINTGLSIYMRFYFTVKHSNTVLGLVYMGAAVLIIIIGLRGLKFIPPTQPSLVLFALGLEFSLLISYAFTIVYTKDEDNSNEISSSRGSDNFLLSNEFGSSKEVEK
ncbi:MAG: hypothetical protein PF588_10250, partial [Candidatus Kapabacteria bacterium]|nr:hypothetical protein [Candidatus Kapabacteria bacterium]